jgi:hypothetical protein
MPSLFENLMSRFDGVEFSLPTREEVLLVAPDWVHTTLMRVEAEPALSEVLRVAATLTSVRVSEALLEVERRDIAGALFDFIAWLSTRPKTICIGAAQPCAGTLADLLAEWAVQRGLSIENARVGHWDMGVCSVDPKEEDGAVEPAD